MATEIERKFTLKNEDWRQKISNSIRFSQGYLAGDKRASVRVRIEGVNANINIKSATLGIHRHEYEYSIPLRDAEEMLKELCQQPIIEKTRHYVEYAGHTWEIDEFMGDNAGLIVAEIELDHEHEKFQLPSWADQEVSHDPRYYNVSLVKHPYKDWS